MHKPRAGRAGAGSTRGTAGLPARGAGVAALLGAAALLATAVPAAHAAPPAQAPAADVVPGTGTETPALVDGLHESADAKAAPADAARGHLAAKEGRYRIADPGRDLTPVQTLKQGEDETVRLQQKHHGVEVLGGQYVVRMEKKDGKRVVTGTSGKYFTGLTATTRATVAEDVAVRRAVSSVAARLGGATLGKKDIQPSEGAKTKAAAALTGRAGGLVVIPKGPGVLTYRVTVRGTDTATGRPVLQDVYVDARAGFPVLQYSLIKTVTADRPAASTGKTSPTGKAAAPKARQAPAAKGDPGTSGTGVKYNGDQVPLDIYFDDAAKQYSLVDYARMASTSKNTLHTWDARAVDVEDASGRWPDGLKEFANPAPDYSGDATEAGAVDAHWAAGQVYDYYKNVHGRDSLDGRGMAINSLVGVTYAGGPFVNAFWDGQKMVYGAGDDQYKTLSADLDVVGHEMTHGVVENTANLVYAGQSGALNEALADYFGNAIDVTASGTKMDAPDSGLLGEDLCRTAKPRACAFRDLNDGRTTSKDYLGVTFSTDNGGVHLNSTIFSGALWDIRQDLDPKDPFLADRLVYKALSTYMTPLDGYTEARNAVVAAAKEMGLSARQQNVVKRSFNAHGIVPGWENAIGVDSDRLFGKLNIAGTGTAAGGGWWATSKSNDDGSEAYSVYAGRVDGTGAPKLISPNDGRYHVYPATDGRTAVWAAFGTSSVDILSRPLAGGPIKTLYSSTTNVQNLRVENGTVVFESSDPFGGRHVGFLKPGDREPTWVDGGRYELGTALPSLKNGKIAYAKLYPGESDYKLGVETYDLATGKAGLTQQLGEPQGIGQTGITGKNVFWLADENLADQGQLAVRRSTLEGTGTVDISAESGPGALIAFDLTASDDAVTVNTLLPDTQYRNETLPKLWQLSADGTRKERLSCNRGEQLYPSAAGGRQVVWLDGTTGWTDLVTRERPAGTC
ncbi:metalloprotease [Streptomyces sp. ERV7]|uniref:M4 family metallopeptidase n=1 Tax=Streptomyces sp. ERV7 TaxID=1322334 RepID=UPI0007F3DC67|nr:M4 family metallopeptidase [Streptomyces sp. ERV7]OAR24776.1 metalloprotease [Streptomyces sp. ERV7]